MVLFFDIPEAMQADLVCQWICLKSMVRLDSAICSKSLRTVFLDLLEFSCRFPQLTAINEEPTYWFVKKRLKTTKLMFGYELRFDADVRLSVLQLNTKSLKILKILGSDSGPCRDGSPSALLDIAEHCPLLEVLSIFGEDIGNDLGLVIDSCSLLATLKLECCINISKDNLETICTSKVLQHLVLNYAEFEEGALDSLTCKGSTLRELYVTNLNLSGIDLVNLLACFPNVTCLDLGPIIGEDLCSIATHCTQVQNACIDLSSPLSNEHCQLLSSHWQQIELLQLRISQSHPTTCNEDAVLIFLNECKHLRKLSVSTLDHRFGGSCLYHSNATTGNSVANIAASHTSEETTSMVTDLFLESASEATLSAILSLCPQLNTLSIRHNRVYSPSRTETSDHLRAAEYALALLNYPTCSIRKLHLHNIQTLTGADLYSLSNLEELQLYKIGAGLENASILKVLRNNPALKSITLYECFGLDGKTLLPPLLNLCPRLQSLTFVEFMRSTKYAQQKYVPTDAVMVLQDVVKCCFPHITTLKLIIR